MKFSKLNRVYTSSNLIKGKTLTLSGEYSRYLIKVLRFRLGNQLRVFNENDGEFLAELYNVQKDVTSIKIMQNIRSPLDDPELTLALCLIKADRLLSAINMAVQLGVTEIIPVTSARSQSFDINKERYLKCIIEATEQSERLNPPKLGELIHLTEIIKMQSPLIYANEEETSSNSIYQKLSVLPERVTLIIGPEGGFSPSELAELSLAKESYSISLGPYVLRTETAVAALLGQIQLVRSINAKL